MDKKIVMSCLCALIAIFFIPSVISAASFDCGKAASEVEKIICSDDELSRLDESLNKAYLRALEGTDSEQQTMKNQKQWLKNERNACKDAQCLKDAYASRIMELGWFLRLGTADAAEPVSGTYSSSFPVRDWGAEKETYRLAESKMILSMKDKDTFEFDLLIVGGNFHTCELSGLAVRRGRFFELRGAEPVGDPLDDCVLKFWFQGNSVRLEDDTGKCRGACGQRADFAGAVLSRSGATRKPNQATVIFYLDENDFPVVNLESLGPMSDAMRAILAVYALQNDAGCSGGVENVRCPLTDSLNLGEQCSKEHISFIRTWFNQSIPDMGGYGDHLSNYIKTPGYLESICYKKPDTASVRRIWDIIRVTQNRNLVTVDARGTWRAKQETGRFRYITQYNIDKNSVTVMSHKAVPVGKKK